jgi:hypothetical protein
MDPLITPLLAVRAKSAAGFKALVLSERILAEVN